ncbi:branched-chain amino acid ABC transporter permease [Acidocella aminolytica]|jgi:branched-chain amino acid transport system permease protein|uniref:ABC transporter branched-chain amino acid permease n=1 Tax=Acidocella aminolytica 101 = DSM 11237 TaxID=1120923 RepID=A0A0D6PI33_9PROT|nr:branched-chain amino acid ABC transporter permease [Acidocella aminolytica]GAN80863.1 ABC transporter branched-chain amino acid permease [Acidocella aminolytica 101 = DSM 11237]GBQ34253.1 branched-chain amino acid ABC transporter permease [Acidocella aminolytica 101 = DSM 11237]SHE31444.1 amino acid/amide ABC transporter membrane protein 2, HAAT family [Acidocella aminolytica 101 = DSM 11237]
MSTSIDAKLALNRKSGGRVVAAMVIWVVLLFVPFWLPMIGGYTDLATRALIYAIAASGLNLLLGYTGGLSFGHAAYFGLGAYGAGLCLIHIAPSVPLAILGGTVLGGIAGILVGPMAMKRKGIYFAMITIAFGQMFYFIAVRWNSLTGGEDGLTGFSRVPLHIGGEAIKLGPERFYYLVLVLFALVMAIIWQILRSPLGHSFVAVRENTTRLRFLGVAVDKQIWVAFAISTFIVALAGTLNALLTGFASPDNLGWQLSGSFVVICVLGGMRSFWGPFLGAVIFIVAQDYLSSVTQNWMSFIGLIFVLAVLFFPQGLLGFIKGRGR